VPRVVDRMQNVQGDTVPSDSWCLLCGADRNIVAWCPRCANALGITAPMQGNASQSQEADAFPHNQRQHSGQAATPTNDLTTVSALQSPSPKTSLPKKSAKKSGPKIIPHAVSASVQHHRDYMKHYMARKRAAERARKVVVDPNIVHPNLVDANPSPQETGED
jgi:hypothetical protein